MVWQFQLALRTQRPSRTQLALRTHSALRAHTAARNVASLDTSLLSADRKTREALPEPAAGGKQGA